MGPEVPRFGTVEFLAFTSAKVSEAANAVGVSVDVEVAIRCDGAAVCGGCIGACTVSVWILCRTADIWMHRLLLLFFFHMLLA